MIPVGGISVIAHFLILVGAWLGRRISWLKIKANPSIPASIVGAFLSAGVVFAAGTLFVSALSADNNFDHLAFMRNPCDAQSYEPNNRTIIVRVDDIQAHAWTDISIRMIDDAIEREVPLSLAVIPKYLRTDPEFYSYLRARRCDLEFAVHGWDNVEPKPMVGEFGELTEREAARRLRKSIEVIDRLSRDEVVTFVPPLNQLSKGSKRALEELDFQVISSEGETRYDFDATTFDFKTDTLVTIERVLHDCEQAFRSGEHECVVMVHPQDFMTRERFDEEKYQLYIDMLDEFISRGYSFARFKDVNLAEQE